MFWSTVAKVRWNVLFFQVKVANHSSVFCPGWLKWQRFFFLVTFCLALVSQAPFYFFENSQILPVSNKGYKVAGGMCVHHRLRSAFASAQSDQS